MALTTRDACLLRGNTLDLKPFLCPQAGYLWCIGPVQPSLNCLCPEPADTSYNGDIDVLLRNPWVRIKELLAASGDSKRACELRIMFSFSIQCVHDCCCSLGPMRRHFCVISHAEFMRSSQSNMLDNMLGLSVKESCCAVVFPCGSLLRLCLLEPELRWHFIYINNYCPESPLGLPWSNQTSNALKIAHHVLLMADYKMHCYSCTLLCWSRGNGVNFKWPCSALYFY